MRRCQQKCKPRLFYALESKKHLENKNDEDDDNDGYDAFVVMFIIIVKVSLTICFSLLR